MIEAVVFLGPTLPLAEARARLDAVFLPPAGRGDVFRAAAQRPKPRVIGLIDGYFQSRPAVRHKEILWAMAQGVHVFGAASMGALRAAELHQFGMVGVGQIFEAYRQGVLEDDDEVAVEHGPANLGHLPLSEPMTNIRATLSAAARDGLIAAVTRDRLVAMAKETFYRHRSLPALLVQARAAGLPEGEVARLGEWLARGRVDQKRDDALAMLEAMGRLMASDPPPLRVSYHFEHSEIWDHDMHLAHSGSTEQANDMPLPRQAILDELRLIPGEYAKARQDALTLALALREADRQDLVLSREDLDGAARKIASRRVVANWPEWLAQNHLDEQGLSELVGSQGRLDRIDDMASQLADDRLLDVLRLSGRYAELSQRALRKQRAIAAHGPAGASPLPMPAFQLVLWYFSERLRTAAPLDVDAYAAAQGFGSTPAFYAALAGEFLLMARETATTPAI